MAPVGERSFVTDADVVLFGFPSSAARATIRPRARSWRVGGAARTLGISLVVAPIVALVPPHAPWPIGALAVGVILARRRLAENFTLEGLEGICPKCDRRLIVKTTRLRVPHPVPCEGCHHTVSLRLPEGVLALHEPSSG